jgi:exopolyphosphatase/guanosine-5'-triphosphate,3'-diphosphate pyrophosphatase
MMDTSLRFASVDIGSNAVRLFFGYVFETQAGPVFKKASMVRLPIRLGSDSFHNKAIDREKIDDLISAMHGFTHLMEAYSVISYRAVATSAMRDASNGKIVVAEILEKTGVNIELIDGDSEAALIFENHIAEKLGTSDAFIYMDVGGGSTEFTLFKDGQKIKAHSFNIGTIRLKDDLVENNTWIAIKTWLDSIKKEYKPTQIIGSGGNINTLFKLTELKHMAPLPKRQIEHWLKVLKKLSFDEKISELGLRPDRADVIVPATELFLLAMDYSGCKQVIVPKVGLADGIIHQLYDEYKKTH